MKSKDEIFISLLFEGIDFMAAGMDEIAGLDVPPKKKLERLWKFFAEVCYLPAPFCPAVAHAVPPA